MYEYRDPPPPPPPPPPPTTKGLSRLASWWVYAQTRIIGKIRNTDKDSYIMLDIGVVGFVLVALFGHVEDLRLKDQLLFEDNRHRHHKIMDQPLVRDVEDTDMCAPV